MENRAMQWSPRQDAALQAVSQWLRSPQRQTFYLAGYAGTGKTTLAQHFAADVEGTVLFAAFTGKAAHVLHSKGCRGASTIHSLIYHPKDKNRERLLELERQLTELRRTALDQPGGATDVQVAGMRQLERVITEERDNLAQPAFTLNLDSLVREAELVVIDECSMVDERMGEDLLSFGTPVLVLGDPAQLPPVASGGFFTSREPDFFLDEIHRQARDNPIIALATDVREGRGLLNGRYGESEVIERSCLDPDLPLKVDQILVGRNRTRHASNARVRSLNGITASHPVIGDKLVCLRNNHDLGLLNGSLWSVADIGPLGEERLDLTVEPLDHDSGPVTVEAWAASFGGELGALPWWERKEAEEFDYGYALTVHKAQGSQWGSVLLFDESSCFRQDARKWLYTGITRAAERVTIARL